MSGTRSDPKQRGNRKQRCTAHGRTSGKPCRNWPVPGATVCRLHGGSAPQVREAARQRLLAMLNPALAELQKILRKPETSDGDRLRAIAQVLTQNGFSPEQAVQIIVGEQRPKWEELVDEVTFIVDGDKPALDPGTSEEDSPAAALPESARRTPEPARGRRGAGAVIDQDGHVLADDGDDAALFAHPKAPPPRRGRSQIDPPPPTYGRGP
jgi:hypothetical protein